MVVATTPTERPNEALLALLEQQLTTLPAGDDRDLAVAWLAEFREPLALLTTGAVIGVLQSRANRVSDQQLKALYQQLTPAELNQVATANAVSMAAIATERGREAALLRMVGEKLTHTAAGFLLQGLTAALGAV